MYPPSSVPLFRRPSRLSALFAVAVAVVATLFFVPCSHAVDAPAKNAAGRTVRVGVYDAGSLAYFETDGSAHGFFVEMLNHIAYKEQWTVQYVPGSWQEGLDRLKSDKIDLVLCIGYSEARDKYMDFPKEFLLLNWGVLYKAKGSNISSLLELEGKKVSALKGDVYLTGFRELVRQFNISVEIQEVDQYATVFKAVESGAVAAGVGGNLYGILNENGQRAEQTPVIFSPIKVGYAVNEGKNGDLIAALDRNIAELKANKTSVYHHELEHLLGSKKTGIPKEMYWGLLGVVAALLLATALNIMLKRQVKAKTAHLEAEIVRRTRAEESLQAVKDALQEQNKELQINEEELSTQNEDLLATEEMLRIQIREYEASQNILKSRDEALFNEKAFLRSLIDSADDLIYFKDRNSVYLGCNKSSEAFTGHSEQEQQGKTDFDFFDKEIAEQILKHDQLVLEGGVAVHTEEWVTSASGSRLLLDTVKAPIYGQDGQPIGLVGISRDITRRRQAEEEKATLESQLQQAQKMESVGRLAGGVAHDFNNMLTVILGHAELGLIRLDPAHPVHAGLQEIRRTAERSAELTRQLLVFARKQTISPKVLDLNSVITAMLKMLERLIGEDIQLNWQPGPHLWQVNIDPSQIDQILANLCVNARDSISDIGRITIDTGNRVIDESYSVGNIESKPGEYVTLTVCDDGCGMDKETEAHIFEPFFTTKGSGKGTGLGLATVFGAVKQNNGFINVYSEKGIGTKFTIYLPRHQGNAVQVQEKCPVETAPRGNDTILLVEDEAAILTMVLTMLTEQGYTVLTSQSPVEAIRIAGEHANEIHLLITDVVMPEMNGRDLANNLLANYPQLKCLFMSGYTSDIITHRGVLEEGVNFIQKPFTLPGLASKVREVLDRE